MNDRQEVNDRQDRLLAEELDFYNRNKERFLHEQTNRHLLIKGSKLIGSFTTASQAIGEGVRRFGTGPFLVRLSGADTPEANVPILALELPCQS